VGGEKKRGGEEVRDLLLPSFSLRSSLFLPLVIVFLVRIPAWVSLGLWFLDQFVRRATSAHLRTKRTAV